MPDVSAPSSQWWFRAAGTEKVYGPVSPEVLLGWAREGRVYPEDKVSPDNSSWGDARGLPFLAMDTVIVRPDGRVLGPYHRDAVEALRKVGKVKAPCSIEAGYDLHCQVIGIYRSRRYTELLHKDGEPRSCICAYRLKPFADQNSVKRRSKRNAVSDRGKRHNVKHSEQRFFCKQFMKL